MVEVWFPYGDVEICARIPTRNYLGSIDAIEKNGVSDPTSEIIRALKNPTGTERLSKTIHSEAQISLLIDDRVYGTPNNEIIPPILDELSLAGVEDDNITIFIAKDSHSGIEKITDIIGSNSLKNIEIKNLRRRDFKSEDCKYVGKSSSGTRISLNNYFVNADAKILAGTVDLNSYFGYRGGSKNVLLDVSCEETIEESFSRVLNRKGKQSLYEEDKIREDADDAARLCGLNFSLNIVTNSRNEILSAFAGDFEQVFRKCREMVDRINKIPVERKAEILVVSLGGSPYDVSLQKACKTINRYLEIVKKGGVIVLAAECTNGYGDEVFYEWTVNVNDLRKMEKNLKKNFVFGGYDAYLLKTAIQRVHIILVSILPEHIVNAFNLRGAKSINEALGIAFSIVGEKAKVLSLSQGITVVPFIEAKSKED